MSQSENIIRRQHQQEQISHQKLQKDKEKERSKLKEESKETDIPKARTPSDFSEKTQDLPGKEHAMDIQPRFDAPHYKGSGKLQDKVAIVTGGDSGIGRSVAILFAREGADVVIAYFSEDKDAEVTKKFVEKEGRRCLLVKGDLSSKTFCKKVIDQTIEKFGKLDILVNNAGKQVVQDKLEDISEEQLDSTFRTNLYSMFFLCQEALKYLKEGASIINCTSVTSFKGKQNLIDYSSTKGAITTFTKSLAQNLVERGIRVNAVAPGPVWTPLIISSFSEDEIKNFGKSVPLKRAAQPEEIAPSFVFLASNIDSSYFTAQVLSPVGGTPL